MTDISDLHERRQKKLDNLFGEFYDTNHERNAKELIKLADGSICYTVGLGWMHWTGKIWARDERKVARMLCDAVRSRLADAALDDKTSSERYAPIARWTEQSLRSHHIDGTLKVAQTFDEVRLEITDFDADPYLLNCNNGVVDLRSGKLLEHDSRRAISKLAPVDYDPDARCEHWMAFLRQIFTGNEELVSYIQRRCGYALTADAGDQSFELDYGTGANGKSVLHETILAIMGSYAKTASLATFTVKRQGASASEDLARLHGARLVTVSETVEGVELNTSVVKALTGQDTIPARFLYQPTFEFKPTFKLWIRGNHKPDLPVGDEAIWRRVHLVPFDVVIPAEERVKNYFEDRLREEIPGILAWMVAGARRWYEHQDLAPPEAVTAATDEYRAEMDPLGQYLQDCCDQSPQLSVSASKLYGAFKTWCVQIGTKAPTQTAFGRDLVRRGFKKRTSNGVKYDGIGFRHDNAEGLEQF